MAFFGAGNELRNCWKDSAWFLGSRLVLYLRPLKVLWLSALKLEHCYISCNDSLASASADGSRPHPLLIVPRVPAAVIVCTTAGSWMCTLCVLVNKDLLPAAELDKILWHLRRIFLWFLFVCTSTFLRFWLALGVPPTTLRKPAQLLKTGCLMFCRK